MSSFMLFYLEFKSKKDRLKFEDCLKKVEHIKPKPITDYHLVKPFTTEYVVYDVGCMGYAEPEEILERCLKKKIGIKFMAWMPISIISKDLRWEKLRGRWSN